MVNKEYYMNLGSDLAGSRTKNRFRLELLWGVSKMIDIHKENTEYTIVFDFKCDIEIHKELEFEFYQIKTLNSGSYSIKDLCKIKNGKKASILGNLYALYSPNEKIKLAVVCNQPLKANKKLLTSGESCFGELESSTFEYITKSISKELGIKDIDLDSVFYIFERMDLKSPEDAVLGKLVKSFNEIKGEDPTNPNALYRLILDRAKEKASYEFDIDNYDGIVEKKGITKAEFENMLEVHRTQSKTGIKETEDYIKNIDKMKLRRKYNMALTQIIDTNIVYSYNALSKEVFNFIEKNEDDFNDVNKGIELLNTRFGLRFGTEITEEIKFVYFLYMYNLYVAGGVIK